MLLTALHGQQYRIMTGNVSDDGITVQKKRQNSYAEPVWLNNDQFVFLSTGETLYEYDLRNSELSVLLENVAVFKISNDRKKIAYSLYDKDNTYAGKPQGKISCSQSQYTMAPIHQKYIGVRMATICSYITKIHIPLWKVHRPDF